MSVEAEYVSIQVGFSPVAQGSSVITGGSAAAATATGEADSPLGFLGALLDMLTQGVTPPVDVTANAGGQNADAQPQPQAQTATQADLGAIANLGQVVDATIKNDLPALPEDSTKLVNDLVAALTALDVAAETDEPIDPALHDKLSDTLDELAGMLGITLPAPPAIDPTITAAAAGTVATPDIELDAGLVMQSKPLPPGYELPVQDGAETKSADLAAKFTEAVDQALDVSTDEPETTPAATNAAKPSAAPDETPIDPQSPLGKVIAKLTELAERLDSKSPEIAAKIEAVIEKMTTKALDKEMLARLEAKLDVVDLDALLAPKSESKPAAPAASLFTTPTLAVPAAVIAPKQATPAPKAVKTATEPSEPDLAQPAAAKVAKDTGPAETTGAEPKVHERGSFAQHLNDARAEKLAAAADAQNQAQTPTSQVKTDLGVVAPKTVHSAYQAPMQAVNLPQVAFEVVRQFNQGSSRFQIRLDPPELGRIDVRMQVDGDGNVHARMTVERAETLDLMQRDQRSLEKALAQAGLDSNKTNLEFSLRQNPFGRDGQGQQQQGNQGSPFASRNTIAGTEEVSDIASTTIQYRGVASASGVNLFV